MKKLIDADELYSTLEEVRQDYLEEDTYSSNFAAEVIKAVQDEYLSSAPTVEAEPVRHGRCDMCKKMETGHGRIRLYSGNGWQEAIGRGVDGYELIISHCGEHFATKIDYCPYCGAKMDGGAKE